MPKPAHDAKEMSLRRKVRARASLLLRVSSLAPYSLPQFPFVKGSGNRQQGFSKSKESYPKKKQGNRRLEQFPRFLKPHFAKGGRLRGFPEAGSAQKPGVMLYDAFTAKMAGAISAACGSFA